LSSIAAFDRRHVARPLAPHRARASIGASNSTAASALEQFIMTALLVLHPHNYSKALQRLDNPLPPRDGKHAIDYIEGHNTEQQVRG